MKTTQHTPGPWELGINYVPYNYDYFWCHTPANKEICSIPRTTDAEQAANAHLIAAAPDLLAILQEWFSWHADNFGDFDDTINGELLSLANETEAAIAKAEGE